MKKIGLDAELWEFMHGRWPAIVPPVHGVSPADNLRHVPRGHVGGDISCTVCLNESRRMTMLYLARCGEPYLGSIWCGARQARQTELR
jgi:hypothetical protein